MAGLRYLNKTIVPHNLDKGGDNGGCPYSYKWCLTDPKLALAQYLVGFVLTFVGFPLSYVVTTVLYSKVIGPFPQGKYMGWLACAGGLGRILGPVYASSLFKHFGPRWVSVGINIMYISVIILMILTWKRVVPYDERCPKVTPDTVISNTVTQSTPPARAANGGSNDIKRSSDYSPGCESSV